MASLRHRIYAASGLLIGLQIAGTVLGFASWGEVRRAGGAEESIAAQREAMLRLSTATRRVVQGLLGFARPGEEPAENMDLAAAAAAAAGRLLPTADMRDIRIRVDAEPGVSTVASPSAVRQVFDNLVRNAVDASPTGAEVEIIVRAGPLVEVRDRGGVQVTGAQAER